MTQQTSLEDYLNFKFSLVRKFNREWNQIIFVFGTFGCHLISRDSILQNCLHYLTSLLTIVAAFNVHIAPIRQPIVSCKYVVPNVHQNTAIF